MRLAAAVLAVFILSCAPASAATVPLNGRSFDAAYAAASCGDTITIPTGNLPRQDIDEPGKQCSEGAPVVFAPATGARVSVARVDVARGSSIELRDLDIDVAYTRAGAQWITFRRGHITLFYLRGSDHVRVLGTDVGPSASGFMSWVSADGQKPARDVVFDGVRVHDFYAAASGDHTDCIGVDNVEGFTFRNGRVEGCQHFAIIFGNDFNGRAASDVLVENSVLECCTTVTGVNAGFYSVGFGGLDGPVVLRGNSLPRNGLGWLNGTDLVPNGLVTVEGNTLASNNTGNCSRATWRGNTVTSGACAGDTPGPQPTPTPSPTASPSPEPTPTATPVPEPGYNPACAPSCDEQLADLRTETAVAAADVAQLRADLAAEHALRVQAEQDRDAAQERLVEARRAWQARRQAGQDLAAALG